MRYLIYILLVSFISACNSYDNYAKKAQKTLIELLEAIEKKDVKKAKELCSSKGIIVSERDIILPDSIALHLSKQSITDDLSLRSWLNSHKDLIMNQEEKSYTWSGDTIKFSYGHDFQHQFYSIFVLDKNGRYQLVDLSTYLLK